MCPTPTLEENVSVFISPSNWEAHLQPKGAGSLFVDFLCGLVVRLSGYRSKGPGFDSRPFQIF
jgi:hypothetical protein